MRLNKYIAHSGICSRRKAGDLVKAGAVKVNGEVLDNPAYEVQKEDKVEYKGKVVRPVRKMIYILMNKPKNVVTTTSDEKARRTVMDIVQNKVSERIYPVGRLDRMTTGLLLLTNDGDLAKKLTHPSHGVVKRYHVILNKVVTEQHLKAIKKGLHLEDGLAMVDDADWIIGSDNDEVGIEIHMGKNRIVRRIFESLGYTVVRLDRVYYGGLTKKDLPRGWFRNLKMKEIIMLKHFSGNDQKGDDQGESDKKKSGTKKDEKKSYAKKKTDKREVSKKSDTKKKWDNKEESSKKRADKKEANKKKYSKKKSDKKVADKKSYAEKNPGLKGSDSKEKKPPTTKRGLWTSRHRS